MDYKYRKYYYDKVSKLQKAPEFLASRLSLFHSAVEEGKKKNLKCLILTKGILSQYPVLWSLNLVGKMLKRYRGELFLKTWNYQRSSEPASILRRLLNLTFFKRIFSYSTYYCQCSIVLNRLKFFVKRRPA